MSNRPVVAAALLLALIPTESQAFEVLWKNRLFGTHLGSRGLLVRDVGGDGTNDVIASSMVYAGSYAGSSNSWVVLSRVGSGYEMVWSSPLRSNLVRLDATDDAIYAVHGDGTIDWYDSYTLALVESGHLSVNVKDAVLADIDGDAIPELIALYANNVAAYRLGDWAQVWSAPYGGDGIAAGNFDADASAEVAISGIWYDQPSSVIDVASGTVQWNYIDGFGRTLRAAQLDEDEPLELLSTGGWYAVTAYDVDVRSPKFQLDIDLDVGALRPIDTDGDGIDEIVVGEGQWGDEIVFDAVTRDVRWSIHNPEHGTTDVAIANIDGDAGLEIIWGAGATSTGPDHLFVAGVGGTAIDWQSPDLVGPFAVAAVDLDDDGAEEIFAASAESNSGYDNPVIQVFDGHTHALRGTLDDYGQLYFWTGLHSIRVADVDDDGALELVLGTASLYDGVVLVYDAATLALKRTSAITRNNRYFDTLEVGDVDGDGHTEIVVGEAGGSARLIVYDGATLTPEWTSTALAGSVRDIELADVDADGVVEVVAATTNRIYVYDGVSHVQQGLWAVPAQSVTTAQLDGDAALEIVSGGANGTLSVLDGITGELGSSFATGGGAIQAVRVVGDVGAPLELVVAVGGSVQRRSLTGTIIERIDGLTPPVADYGQLTVRALTSSGRENVLVGTGDAVLVLGRDAPVEACNGVDDDGDGLADNGLVRTCSTSCGYGVERCVSANWAGCSAPLEENGLCPHQRQPCDATPHGEQRACSSACGVGTQVCNNGNFTICNAQAPVGGVCLEACDGLSGAIRSCNTTCGYGSQTCSAGFWSVCNAPVANGSGICPGDCEGGHNGDRRECGTACNESFCVDGAWTACTPFVGEGCPLEQNPGDVDEPGEPDGGPIESDVDLPPPDDDAPVGEGGNDNDGTNENAQGPMFQSQGCAQTGGSGWLMIPLAFVVLGRRRPTGERSST